MKHTLRFLGQKKILVTLSFLLIMSIGLNAYLFFGVMTTKQKEKSEEESSWISGSGSQMWEAFSVKLTPNKAVFSYPVDRQVNISVRGLRWAPFEFGSRTFYFKIYDKQIDRYSLTNEHTSRLIGEKTIIANKSEDEMYYEILFNFTVTFDAGGIYLYRIIGATWPVTLTDYDCIATFALNVWL